MQYKTSNKICPDNMTIEEWQISLRKENAIASDFEVKHMDNNRIWGDYSVQNNHGSYKVAFRGVCSDRNYCSCLDFRTNGLGTCKHIESVMIFLQSKVPGYPWGGMDFNPEYTSIYVSYKGGRSIKIRIGSRFIDEFNSLKDEYFDENNTLPEDKYYLFDEIYDKAIGISVTTKIYDDVKDFVKEVLNKQKWVKDLENTYIEKIIPWNKNEKNYSLYTIEKYLYDITMSGCGMLVCKDVERFSHIVARLSEEVYQGEVENLKGYIVSDNDRDVLCYQRALKSYTESSNLPIEVVSYRKFVDEYRNGNKYDEQISFLYISNSECLKEWKNQLSVIIKQLKIKHLYMHVKSLKEFSSVQLSSILQHISPFVIGPFYKFIHKYRLSFPLDDIQERLPDEIKNVVFVMNDGIYDFDFSKLTDINIREEDKPETGITNMKSIDKVEKLISLFKDIAKDEEAIGFLIKGLGKI